MAESQVNDNTCVVCFKTVVYYSIGECDHPVCFECSTRMRVLCQQNECPICRQDLARVVFTETVQPYKELRNRVFSDKLFERQYKIGFSSEEIKREYEVLLENRCTEKSCKDKIPFRTFSMLSDHMRKAHERYYCDLCVKHLKIFTSERRCYTRQELAHHRRKGDVDNTSHRGHPLCEFCEERFMDADELYRHLRKEHLYCHLCDADGRNLYYASHSALAHHFRTEHYLCEEGECAGQHLTAVFRSEIDLKGHKATVHGRGMPRGATRQARTLELQFNITPHPVVQRVPRDRDRQEQAPPVSLPAAPQASINPQSDEQFPRLSAAQPAHAPLMAGPARGGYRGAEGLARNDRNFPALDGSNGPAVSRPQPARPAQPVAATVLRNSSKPSVSIQLHSQPSASNFRLTQTSGNRISIPPQKKQHSANNLSDDDFPSLGLSRDDHPSIGAGTVQASKVTASKPSVSIQLHSQPSASNFRLTQTSGNRISIPPQKKQHSANNLSDDDFPSLGLSRDDHPSIGAGTVQASKVSLINSDEMRAFKNNHTNSQPKKAQLGTEAFPALSSSSTPTAPPQWITVSKSKEKGKPKPDPPPVPTRETGFNPIADFPTLPINTKTKSKKTQLQLQSHPKPQPQPTNNNISTESNKNKKEKKKQNKTQNPVDFDLVNGVNDLNMKKEYLAASVNNNNNSAETDRKIKTISDTPSVHKNTGNGDFNLAIKEYPPLNPRADKFVPPSVKTENFASKIVQNGSAPPSKKRPPCDGMTFTNSAGQTFPAPVHSYIPPPDFEQRNRALVKQFAVALGGAAAVEDFKVASRAFRDSIISAEEFYLHCQAALGSQLETVFPDLVALLPDIAKQQELVIGRDIGCKLEVCSTCGQLLSPNDRIAHDTAHWPPLSSR
ncbi:E3 ubiquitin-protein ligase ZNF598 isoform X2 [Maniola hyperantus]|uniref:E3 ubiquitin-protein ligase ZNF598 isoform X2 n=1 Tax=Aphantopus hyperantus TaxID=2795564 RepID=UPI003749CE3B